MPKVSFIMPAYKRRFLKEAIVSILAQTYRNFELIVVDDKSPQNLREVVDQFSDARLTYYCNEQNLGSADLIAAWNKALAYAKGEFVICAGDDDVYHPEYLQEMMSLSDKYPLVNAFHCRIAIIDGNGQWKYVGHPRAEHESGIQMMYFRGVKHYDCQRIPEFMFRTTELLKMGGFVHTKRAWWSDVATVIAMSFPDGVCCSPRILFYWRASGENISTLQGDIADKLEASHTYNQWLETEINRAEIRFEDDEKFLSLCRCEFDMSTFRSYQGLLEDLPLLRWLQEINNPSIPTKIKQRMVKSRIHRLFRPYW